MPPENFILHFIFFFKTHVSYHQIHNFQVDMLKNIYLNLIFFYLVIDVIFKKSFINHDFSSSCLLLQLQICQFVCLEHIEIFFINFKCVDEFLFFKRFYSCVKDFCLLTLLACFPKYQLMHYFNDNALIHNHCNTNYFYCQISPIYIYIKKNSGVAFKQHSLTLHYSRSIFY